MFEKALTPLCELAVKHRTDKGGWHTFAGGFCHNYTPVYHALFGNRRSEVRKVLEVGVLYGASLRMWEDYFPSADIFGFDHDEKLIFHKGRIRCFKADQSFPESLRNAVLQTGGEPFDLIVEDGSHIRRHQVITANTLIHYLSDCGSYFTEDISGPTFGEPACRPDLLAAEMDIPEGFSWRGLPAGDGLGPCRCKPDCRHCKGRGGEHLLEIHRQTKSSGL